MKERSMFRKKRYWVLLLLLLGWWVGSWIYTTWFKPKDFYDESWVEWRFPGHDEDTRTLDYSSSNRVSSWDDLDLDTSCHGKECGYATRSYVTFPRVLENDPFPETTEQHLIDLYEDDIGQWVHYRLSHDTQVRWYPWYPIYRYPIYMGYRSRCYPEGHRLYRAEWCQGSEEKPPTAIYEPSSIWLLVIGLSCLWIVRYRE